MNRYLFLLCSFLPVAFSSSQGNNYSFPSTNPLINVTIPEGWPAFDGVRLTIQNPEGDLSLQFALMPVENIDEAIDAANMTFGITLSDINLEGKPSKWEGSGVSFFEQNETAVDEFGQLVYLTVIFIKLRPENNVLVMYSAAPSADEYYKEQVTQILESITPSG